MNYINIGVMTDDSQRLVSNYKIPDHPIAVLIRGIPGSGKSHLAKCLQRKLGEEMVVMLDPDATDYESKEYLEHVKSQTVEGVDPKLHAYRFLRAQAYQAIADRKIIIWNQPFTNLEIFNKMIGRLNERAKQEKTSLPILVVEVNTHPAAAKARVDQRKQTGGHGPSDNTFQRFINDYKSFASEGFNTVSVDGAGDTAAAADVIIKKLDQLV